MKKLLTLLCLLIITVSCFNDQAGINPDDVSRNEGSDLLEFRAAYTIVGSDGTSWTIDRELTHTFDQDCRLTGRREVYRQHNEPYGIERFVYAYNDTGLLSTQKQYETYGLQPERLLDHITYAYDVQGRLIRQNHQNEYGGNWTFEYIDDKKQVNRYACPKSGGDCTLSTITVDGKRTYPDSGDRANGYVSSSPNPYGNMLYETVDAKGNQVLVEVYKGTDKKTLLEKIVQTYDAQRAIPLAINEVDFKGYPVDDRLRLGNNMVQSDHYTYDQATGAVSKHLRSVSQYTYNQLGYPTRVNTEEKDMMAGKSTGIRTSITVRYGCGH